MCGGSGYISPLPSSRASQCSTALGLCRHSSGSWTSYSRPWRPFNALELLLSCAIVTCRRRAPPGFACPLPGKETRPSLYHEERLVQVSACPAEGSSPHFSSCERFPSPHTRDLFPETSAFQSWSSIVRPMINAWGQAGHQPHRRMVTTIEQQLHELHSCIHHPTLDSPPCGRNENLFH